MKIIPLLTGLKITRSRYVLFRANETKKRHNRPFDLIQYYSIQMNKFARIAHALTSSLVQDETHFFRPLNVQEMIAKKTPAKKVAAKKPAAKKTVAKKK